MKILAAFVWLISFYWILFLLQQLKSFISLENFFSFSSWKMMKRYGNHDELNFFITIVHIWISFVYEYLKMFNTSLAVKTTVYFFFIFCL